MYKSYKDHTHIRYKILQMGGFVNPKKSSDVIIGPYDSKRSIFTRTAAQSMFSFEVEYVSQNSGHATKLVMNRFCWPSNNISRRQDVTVFQRE